MVAKNLTESLENENIVHDRRLRAVFVENLTGGAESPTESDENDVGEHVLPKTVRFDSVEVREHAYIL